MQKLILILALVISASAIAHGQTTGDQVNLHRDLSASFNFWNMWQSPDRIQRPCASGTTSSASVIANPNNTGNVAVTTCQNGFLTVNGVNVVPGGGGFGNVVGTPPTTTNAVARYTDATGLLIKNSSWIIDNSGNATTPGGLTTGNAGGVSGSVALSGATSGTVVATVAAVAGSWTLTLPTTDGNANEFLQTNGSGVTTWAAATGTTINATDGVVPYRSNATTFADSPITRNDANTVSFINGTNAQTAYVYQTFTNATNFYRANLTGNALQFDKGSASGSAPAYVRNLNTDYLYFGTGGNTYWAISSSGNAEGAGALIPVGAAYNVGAINNGIRQLFAESTITAGGTTGNQTIDKAAGSVNFAAAATSLVVTSNKVTASSIVLCTVATNDTTLKAVQCVPGAGSFTMFASAAATAETRVNFWILNQ